MASRIRGEEDRNNCKTVNWLVTQGCRERFNIHMILTVIANVTNRSSSDITLTCKHECNAYDVCNGIFVKVGMLSQFMLEVTNL